MSAFTSSNPASGRDSVPTNHSSTTPSSQFGIQATTRGQIDAAQSLGLTRWQTTRLIVVPLALRIIVPPLGAYYIVVLKNSSLGSAIAYPDLILIVAGTILNQTGQPIEAMTITLAAYLVLGVAIALLTSGVNRYLLR